jgi:glycosyltransferase involved in cell wall biosynthesis
MNIAIFTNNYLPNPYGVSGSIESFRKEFERRGHTVYIFAPKTKGYVDENPNVYRYPSVDIKYKISFPLAIPFSGRVDKILEKLDIDIIHSQHPNLLGWAAKKWAKKKKVPLVFTWHTLYDQYAHFAPPFIPRKLAQWWTIRNAVKYANNASQIIVPTPSVKKIIRTWGVTNGNIVAIPTGVEEKMYQQPNREIYRKKFFVVEDEIVLITVSRLTAEKNVRFLFEAVCRILKKTEKIKFLVNGSGHEQGNLEEIVRKYGVSDKIFFEPSVSKQNIKDFYAAGDIFVYASKSETQGMVISEALYSGLPVVAVAATGVKDIVMNQVDGILAKDNIESLENSIMRLINDGALRKRYSDNARRIAREKFTSVACAKRMLETYGKIA